MSIVFGERSPQARSATSKACLAKAGDYATGRGYVCACFGHRNRDVFVLALEKKFKCANDYATGEGNKNIAMKVLCY